MLLRRLRAAPGGPARRAHRRAWPTALAAGCATQALGLEAVLGAFVAGIVLGRSKFQHDETFALLDRLTGAFLAPIFFSTAGLRVDLGLLARAAGRAAGAWWCWSPASVSKFAGAYLGGWFAGLPVRERLALGAGLNARGAVEIVVATVGLSVGVLNGASYAVIVLMAMATSIAAPPLLRLALRGWQGSEEEQLRLERERMLRDNVLVRATRVLLPSHGGPNSLLAARIVDLAWPREVEVTLLSAGADVPPEDLARVRASSPSGRSCTSTSPTAPRSARSSTTPTLGYGAIAVGATDVRVEGRLVSPVIDELLGASPLPVVMVRRGVARESRRAARLPTHPGARHRHRARPRRAGDGLPDRRAHRRARADRARGDARGGAPRHRLPGLGRGHAARRARATSRSRCSKRRATSPRAWACTPRR